MPERSPEGFWSRASSSEWLAGREGLAEAARTWVASEDYRRGRRRRAAERTASPTFDAATLAALARTAGHVAPVAAAALRDRRRGGTGWGGAARLEEMVHQGGPIYVKLGQFVTSARGLLPEELTDAFAWCQDQVSPVPVGTVERILQRSLGRRGRAELVDLDPEPLAAASISQVHTARLRDGTPVVVKVRRPGLHAAFERDIRALAAIAAVADRVSSEVRAVNPGAFLHLFAELFLAELDFRAEAANIVEGGLAVEAAGHGAHVRVPRPIPHLVSERVLVMERLEGRSYLDHAQRLRGTAAGRELLEFGVTATIEHALVSGVFHGDLHAGNVLVDDTDSFGLVDWGIVGRLDDGHRRALGRILMAMVTEDRRAQLQGLVEFGAIPSATDLAALDVRLADALERALGPGAHQPDSLTLEQAAQAMAVQLTVLAGAGFRIPAELLLVMKNLLYLNGMAQALAPELDLLSLFQPIFAYFATKHPELIAELGG